MKSKRIFTSFAMEDKMLRDFLIGQRNNHHSSIDFTDMVWLPYELTLNPIGLQYDYIFIDECQDLNAAQRELFLRCFRRGTRFIAVGDNERRMGIETGQGQII